MNLLNDLFTRTQQFWGRWVDPSPVVRDRFRRQQARLLTSFLLVLIVAALLGLVFLFVQGYRLTDPFLLITLGGGGGLVGLYRLSRTSYYQLAAFLTVCGTMIGIFLAALPPHEGPEDVNLLIYLVIPVLLSSVFLSLPATALLVAVELAGMLLIGVVYDDVALGDLPLVFLLLVSVLLVVLRHVAQSVEKDTPAHDDAASMQVDDLVEDVPVAVAVIAEGVIRYANVACAELLGAEDASALVGLPAHLFWEHPFVSALPTMPVRALPQELPVEQTLTRLDGRKLDVEVIALPFLFAGKRAVRVVTLDVSHRQRIVQSERDQRALAEALVEVATVINSDLDQHQVLDNILRAVQRVVPYDAASIMLLVGDVARVVHSRGFEKFGAEAIANSVVLKLEEHPELRLMIQLQIPAIIADTRVSPHWKHIEGLEWIRSQVAVPIITRDGVVGVLNLDSTETAHFDQHDADRLQAFATQAAIAIRNARLYSAVLSYAGELERRVEARTLELRRTTERVQAILDNSSDAILMVTPDGHILQANNTCRTMFGYTPESLRDRPLVDLAADAYTDKLADALYKVGHSGTSTTLEIVALREDGSAFPATVGLTPVGEQDQPVTSVVCTIHDITERKQAEQNLLTALERERELGELKSRFVSMASHEFRTPLATIQVAAEMLRHYSDRMTDEQRERDFDKIQNQIKHMTALLEDVLTVGRLEQNRIELQQSTIDLNAFVEEIVGDFQRTHAQRQFILEKAEDPLAVVADAKLMRQVFGNLISNAVKYSPPETPVRIDLHRNNVSVSLTVRDEGIGIPPDELSHIFDAFHRANNVGPVAGTGLGLAIVRQAVELHGGTIEVESREHQGSAFTVILPLSGEQEP